MRRVFVIAALLMVFLCILTPFVLYSRKVALLKSEAYIYYVLGAAREPMGPSDVNRSGLVVTVMRGQSEIGQLPLYLSKESGLQLTRDKGELRVGFGGPDDFLQFFSDGRELRVGGYGLSYYPYQRDFEALVITQERGEPLPVSAGFVRRVKLREFLGMRGRFDVADQVNSDLLYRYIVVSLGFTEKAPTPAAGSVSSQGPD